MAERRTSAHPQLQVVSATGIVPAIDLQVDLPAFSGSLPALFAAVRDSKLELMDVPLAPICEAYFLYLIENAEADLDQAAAALTALAWLLERKAWALLPIEESEVEEYEEIGELPEPTAHEYFPAIEALRQWEEERAALFFRSHEAGPEPYELPLDLGDVSADDLARAFARALARANPTPPEPLNKQRRSLSEQMGVTLRALPAEWTSLENLIEQPYTKLDAVYWFLSLLELIRLGQAKIRLYDGDVQFARNR